MLGMGRGASAFVSSVDRSLKPELLLFVLLLLLSQLSCPVSMSPARGRSERALPGALSFPQSPLVTLAGMEPVTRDHPALQPSSALSIGAFRSRTIATHASWCPCGPSARLVCTAPPPPMHLVTICSNCASVTSDFSSLETASC